MKTRGVNLVRSNGSTNPAGAGASSPRIWSSLSPSLPLWLSILPLRDGVLTSNCGDDIASDPLSSEIAIPGGDVETGSLAKSCRVSDRDLECRFWL